MIISMIIAVIEFIWKQRKLAVDENVSISKYFKQWRAEQYTSGVWNLE